MQLRSAQLWFSVAVLLLAVLLHLRDAESRERIQMLESTCNPYPIRSLTE
jgi:hypothetical protein